VKRLFGQSNQKNEIIRRIRDACWDVHVDLKPFKGVMNFHVRRYERGGHGVVIPTKQWVTLKHSRWLIPEQQIRHLENSLEKTLSDQMEREYKFI
jgi:hypothetical protein